MDPGRQLTPVQPVLKWRCVVDPQMFGSQGRWDRRVLPAQGQHVRESSGLQSCPVEVPAASPATP